jgi:hypothetical protein
MRAVKTKTLRWAVHRDGIMNINFIHIFSVGKPLENQTLTRLLNDMEG